MVGCDCKNNSEKLRLVSVFKGKLWHCKECGRTYNVGDDLWEIVKNVRKG